MVLVLILAVGFVATPLLAGTQTATMVMPPQPPPPQPPPHVPPQPPRHPGPNPIPGPTPPR